MAQSKHHDQLFAALKVEWTAATYAGLAQLSAAAWEELFTVASQQGVLSVLWQRLQRNGQLGLVPALLAQRVQERVKAATVSFVRANLFAICRTPPLFFDISNPLTNLVAMLYSIPVISLPIKPFVLRSTTVCRI